MARMAEKNQGGRPSKYKEEYAGQAYKLCLLGAIDTQLADFFGVSVDTIHEWKKVHPKFSYALKESKAEADAQVKRSLYSRANGYSHKEDKIFCNKDGLVTTVETIKEYAPDTTACIFWLKNRQPADWRDKVQQEITNPDGSLRPASNPEVLAKLNRIIDNARMAKQKADTPGAVSIEDEDEFI